MWEAFGTPKVESMLREEFDLILFIRCVGGEEESYVQHPRILLQSVPPRG